MEQYLAVIPAKQFDRIHRKHFCGHLVEMANHPLANFVLQKFVSVTRTPEQVCKERGKQYVKRRVKGL